MSDNKEVEPEDVFTCHMCGKNEIQVGDPHFFQWLHLKTAHRFHTHQTSRNSLDICSFCKVDVLKVLGLNPENG